MGTFVTKDLTVAAGISRTFAMNTDHAIASALIVGDWQAIAGQVYYEPQITNRGEMILDPNGLAAGDFFHFNGGMQWYRANLQNYGTIDAVAPSMLSVRVVGSFSYMPDIFNHGTIVAQASISAEGVRSSDSSQIIYNGKNALLDVTAGGQAFGIYLSNGGEVTNEGTIRANTTGGTAFPESEGAYAIAFGFGGIVDLTLDNSGLIEATGVNSSQDVAAIMVRAEVPFDILNTGTIRGPKAIDQYVSGNPGPFEAGHIENRGQIDGTITLAGGDDTIINTGMIKGQVKLGGGDDLLDAADGRVTGLVYGEDGNDTFHASRYNDLFDGGERVDTVVLAGNRASYTISQPVVGIFDVAGPGGKDRYWNVEYLQFDDGSIHLLRGTGTQVSFGEDPTSYQSAMDQIRDFGGNKLGGEGAWKWIGSADVNGDGDIDHVLVNDAIARFSTVAVADDGLVYFWDHSWAGETRVAGIYIDPLVVGNEVEAGGPFDSQTRFSNDLKIGNISKVLGAGDYDGDGLQEIYFALTDGTAYLHAHMHADGNIRYANYQTETQVIDFLSGNGYGVQTYAGWFG